jgi:hypothetical protein
MNNTVFDEIVRLLKAGHSYENIVLLTGYSLDEILKIDNWRNQVKTKGAKNA